MEIQPLYKVSEIFASIEGEGKRTGLMSVFVRFHGCNLHCSYCDSLYAVDGKDYKLMTQEDIIHQVLRYPWKCVTFTGGEPLLYDLHPFTEALAVHGITCNIETNGATPLPDVRLPGTFYTMDWKCPSSGMNSKMLAANLHHLRRKDVLKFVVGTEEDLDEMVRVLDTGVKAQIYVSPVFGQIDPKDIVEYIKTHGLYNVKIQIQLHKIIYNPMERGV